jgi:uncharacterized protein (TIRG00374 family)
MRPHFRGPPKRPDADPDERLPTTHETSAFDASSSSGVVVSSGLGIGCVRRGPFVKRTAFLILKLLVSLLLLTWVFRTTDLVALEERVRSGDLLLLSVAVGLYFLLLFLSTWRWRILLEALGFSAPLRKLSSSYLVALFFNNFLPSNVGGDFVRIRDSSRLTGSTTTSLAVVAIDRIVGLAALWALAAGAYGLAAPDLRGLAGASIVIPGLGTLFALLAVIFFRAGIARWVFDAFGLNRHAWARERFEVVQRAIHVYRERTASIWLAFGGSLLLQACVVFFFWAVARALQIPLPLGAAFLIVPLCTLAQTVPVSFNGWGLRESVYLLYFHQLGLPRDSALAASLVSAGLTVVLSLSGAVVWLTRGSGEPEADGSAT